MAYEIIGLDLSKYQGPWDFVKSVEVGLKFAIIRAGGAYQNTGLPFTDYRFTENARKAAEALMPAGFYWYFVPNGDPYQQADYFVNLIKDKKQQIPPVMDLEYASSMTPAQITDRAGKFINRIEELTGLWPLVYARSNWLQDHTIPADFWAFTELHIARYIAANEPWGNPGDPATMAPPHWNTWRFWQYTSQAPATQYGGLGPPAGDDDLDLNYFNGSEADFKKYIGATDPEPVPVIVKVHQIKNSVLRDEPKGTMIAIAPYGVQYSVIGAQVMTDGSLWYDVGGAWILASHVAKL